MSWNMQLVRIYEKGMKAFEDGKKSADCPYPWARTGFNRQRRDYWMKGFDDAVIIAADQRIFDRVRKEATK